MNRRFLTCALVAVSALSIFTPFKSASALDADTMHWAAWDSALAVSESTPAQRYAFYAYRTLAVPHPEIYLQADAVFSSIVESMPGSRVAFKGANVRDLELFRRLLNGEQQGPSFDWRMWVPLADSIYDSPAENSAMSWLDHRVASAAVLLTAPSPRMSTAEAAMMRYTQLRRSGTADSSLFVIVDINGHGYLANDGVLISPQTGRAWGGDASMLVPALVFNERFVVYPLFGRDDRLKSASLAKLMNSLAAKAQPPMSEADSTRAAHLRTAAALPNRHSLELARISALGALGLANQTIRTMWSTMLGQSEPTQLGCEQGMLRLIIYRANLLSRHTATLAAAGPDTPFDSAAAAWERLYLSWGGRLVNPRDTANQVYEAGGYLWAFELLELSFDDIIRTRSGSGASQSLAMAAALDMRGVPNMRVEIDPGDDAMPNQHWILCENGNWQFNFGHWKRVQPPDDSPNRFPMIINSCGVTDRWSHLIFPYLYSNTDPFTITEELTRLSVIMPRVSLMIRTGEKSSVTFAEFMRQMTDDRLEWHDLPWPDADDDAIRGDAGK